MPEGSSQRSVHLKIRQLNVSKVTRDSNSGSFRPIAISAQNISDPTLDERSPSPFAVGTPGLGRG